MQASLARVAEEAAQLWFTNHPGEDIGVEMRAIVDKAVKEIRKALQTKFNKEQAVANPALLKEFMKQVILHPKIVYS